MTDAFQLLHPTVQRKLWDMKWTELRPIQVDAIEHLLGGTPADCIISSPTASGKKEAAFLPVLSAIADEPTGGVRAIYIGPLKALINDQFGRVEQLCERMEMPVHRWHGDVDAGAKKAVLAAPSGVLLITPESLEAMFVLRPTQLPAMFGRLAYVVIDEMHAFLGSQRGAQLISQLHRLRVRTGRDATRIGLSATLGDRDAAKRWLRRDGRPVRVIDSSAGGSEIRLKLRGMWRASPEKPADADTNADDPALVEVARAILLACHGKTNLVFANAKGVIEALADELTTQAREMAVPGEIVVHHGSLSKEAREHAEQRLRSGAPCTAVCSNTLELGIDIGAIDEVVQVSPPWSVASLVQRLGRSGRTEGKARVLRGYFIEDVPDADATLWDRLHLDFVRGIATIDLMLDRWLEAPEVDGENLSTLVQQLLSTLAETGGIRAHELYPRLAESGAFAGLSRADFAMLLRELGARDLVEQLPDATLVLGLKGQRIVEHYSFYAAFKAPTEFQVLHRDRSIGTLPESMLPAPGEHLILAGRRWRVEEIDVDRRQVYVSPSRGRRPPRFAFGQPDVAPRVHARMRALLLEDELPTYLDETAVEILQRARTAARDANLGTSVQLLADRAVLSMWAGTRIQRTICLALASAGLRVEAASDVALEVHGGPSAWLAVLDRFVDTPDGIALATFAEEKLFARITDGEKFDVFLPSALWRASYVRDRLDLEGAVRKARRLVAEARSQVSQLQASAISATVVSIPDIHAWADAIVTLDAPGPLPTRIVLVPSETHAHALRAKLVIRAPHALAGTRFFTVAAAARAVLDATGVVYRLGEEDRRSLRLRKVLRAGPALATYRVDDLHTPGWEDAFASTIEQLESAGLRPDDLDRVCIERLDDLASIWRAADEDAGTSWSLQRVIAEAHAVLAARPSAWPFDGPVLAVIGFGTDSAHARFLHAIPKLTLGIIPGRPARHRAVDRTRALLGTDAAAVIASHRAATLHTGELGVLAENLFESPEQLSSDVRRRSAGPDGSVALELHAGVDEELDAAVRWLAEQVFDHRTPLQDLAILLPNPDPIGALLADRIEAMSWPTDAPPVYLACARPAVSTSAGARLLAVVQALELFLPADAMVEILPRLRLSGSDRHLYPGRAREVVAALATMGGSARRPHDAARWRDRLSYLEDSVRAVTPAVEALVAVAMEMIGDATLADVWRSIREFATTHLIAPRELPAIVDQLDADIRSLAADPVTASVLGVEAVQLVAARLRTMRVDRGRYGDPAIYVGTITGAAGLPFSAVRIIGVAEGAFPGTLREDAILPSDLRRRLPSYAMINDADYANARLHAFDHVIRTTGERLVISAPRTDLDGSEREPASLFVEVAAALARPNSITGARAPVIPTSGDLERDAFRVARSAIAVRHAEMPLTPASWLDRIAGGARELPSAWSTSPVLDPARMLESAVNMDGDLGPAPLVVSVPGLQPELALSASALRVLLTCPHRFLLERLLGFWARGAGASNHRIDPAGYGSLFHEIADGFSREHGVAFGSRERSLDEWRAIADESACAAFAAFLNKYPLVGHGAIDAERERLRRDVRTFVEDDWDNGRARTFVASERAFGEPSALAIETSAGPLFLKGRIDRIDIEHGLTLVRDLKTGRAHPRERDEADLDVDLDLQLAVYVAVAKRLAAEWSIPADIAAAYVYVDTLAANRERSFRSDRHALQVAGNDWFDLAMALIRDRSYVKTPDPDDCRRCSFSPVCGDDSRATAERLRETTGVLATFRELKA